MNLFFDTETSGLPKFKSPNSDPGQPWIVQLAAVLSTNDKVLMSMNFIIQSGGLPIHPKALEVHGISTNLADKIGFEPQVAFSTFLQMAEKADKLICHNTSFDMRLLEILATRLDHYQDFVDTVIVKPHVCTMIKSTNFCKLPTKWGKFKWPKLTELHAILFDEDFEGAHDALNDVYATQRCYYELIRRGIIND